MPASVVEQSDVLIEENRALLYNSLCKYDHVNCSLSLERQSWKWRRCKGV